MKLSAQELKELSKIACVAARDAGAMIATYLGQDVAVEHKTGGDNLASQVVTEVDKKSEALILQALLPTCETYDLAMLTEESEDDRSRFEKDFFWCIDPLDGTLCFIEKKPGFSVSIALVSRDGVPYVGVVYDPVEKTLYEAIRGQGAQRNGSPWNPYDSGKSLTLYSGRSLPHHPEFDRLCQEFRYLATDAGLDGLNVIEGGGAVLNACWSLEHAPACTIKLPQANDGGGSLWDYAATACLFTEVGAGVSDVAGTPLDLNRSESTFMNHRGIVYASDRVLADRLTTILNQL